MVSGLLALQRFHLYYLTTYVCIRARDGNVAKPKKALDLVLIPVSALIFSIVFLFVSTSHTHPHLA